ncbi:MAG TPA: polysaccharide biosynthesis tyrosine autokinase [Gammaproteobacteria bacterium]|nr:polysaccharide biosynthesis tyrosine autokinase [Gammaproteobacteria bacterium]
MSNEQLVDDKVAMNNQVFSGTEDEIDLSELLGTLIEAKWLISIIAGVFLVGGVFYALIATPIYQADAILQIEEKSGGMPGLGDLSDMLTTDALAATEIEIIKSRNIIGKAVDKLNLTLKASPDYLPIIGKAIARRHSGAGVAESSFGMDSYAWGGERIQLQRLVLPSYLSKDGVVLIAGEGQQYTLTAIDGEALLSGKVGEVVSANGVELFVAELVARVGTEFNLNQSSRIKAINDLQAGIKISERGKKTGILRISLDGADPKLIARVVDTVSGLYLRQNVERMSEEAESGLKFLQEQLPLIKDEMEAAEIELNSYRTSKSSVDLTLEAQSLLNKVVTIEAQLAELEVKHSDLSKKYTEVHPIMMTLNNKEAKLKEQLGQINTKAHGLPKTQQEVLRLSRDVEVATTIYTQLLNKVQELKVAKAGTVGNVRIIDTALTAERPIKPKKAMIALLSLVLGLFLGIAVAFVRRAMNKGVEDPDSIEGNIGIPVYANIPLSVKQVLLDKDVKLGKAKHTILCEHDSKDQAIEGLRSLRTNLHFALLEAKNNVVMITGPAPGVGKSFVSTNFAHVVAQANQKVLLIDADMRKGHIHKEYDMTRGPGLSELIIGEIDKATAVRNSGFENVDILTTGNLPPNPSELLMHENFEKYLGEFSKDYDLILIDTPPLLAVTDAAVIGRLCGTTFVLLRYGVHSMSEIQAVTKRLRQNSIEPRGFVFNALQPRKGYDKYGYGKYGYGKYGNYNYEYK